MTENARAPEPPKALGVHVRLCWVALARRIGAAVLALGCATPHWPRILEAADEGDPIARRVVTMVRRATVGP